MRHTVSYVQRPDWCVFSVCLMSSCVSEVTGSTRPKKERPPASDELLSPLVPIGPKPHQVRDGEDKKIHKLVENGYSSSPTRS